MKLFGRRREVLVVSPDPGTDSIRTLPVPDLFSGRRGGASTVTTMRGGPPASNANGPDVFGAITEDWGRRQTLLGYADRVRCEHPDATGWEFQRAASYDSDISTGSRRLNEDDTTLQITAFLRPCSSAVVWDDLRRSHIDVRHEDFTQLGDARFTALDTTGAPVCIFRRRTLIVRVRMTGTLANRQYTRVYAIDICDNLDQNVLADWMTATAHVS